MRKYTGTLFMFFQAAIFGTVCLGGLVFGYMPVADCFMGMEAGAVSFFIGVPLMWLCERLQG